MQRRTTDYTVDVPVLQYWQELVKVAKLAVPLIWEDVDQVNMFVYVSDETEVVDAGDTGETHRMGTWSEVVDTDSAGETDWMGAWMRRHGAYHPCGTGAGAHREARCRLSTATGREGN